MDQECKGISAGYVYLICLICYVRFYFADLNLFDVHRIIKTYSAATSFMIFLFSYVCINNTQFQQHASVWKTDNVKKSWVTHYVCVFIYWIQCKKNKQFMLIVCAGFCTESQSRGVKKKIRKLLRRWLCDINSEWRMCSTHGWIR